MNGELVGAIRNGDKNKFRDFLNVAVATRKDENDSSLLLEILFRATAWGCEEPQLEMLDEVLKHLKDPDETRELYDTPAFVLAARLGLLKVMKRLHNGGSRINSTGYLDRTALMETLRRRPSDTTVEVVKWLIGQGADVNIRDSDGRTAL